MIGIYMIKNNINNKVYIGQSSDIKKRWKKHIEDLNNKNHHNYHLQSAWDKYGSSNFEFIILEICDKSELDKKEEFYIEKYNSLKNGYNLDSGGNGCVGYKHSKEEINKMRLSHDPIAVIQFDINFNKINEFCGGIAHAAKELKYTKECIKRRCDRSSNLLLYKNCYWVYKYEYENEVKEIPITLYEGNAYLIMLHEYNKDGTDMYDMVSFFCDKTHMNNCLGITKGMSNILDEDYFRGYLLQITAAVV